MGKGGIFSKEHYMEMLSQGREMNTEIGQSVDYDTRGPNVIPPQERGKASSQLDEIKKDLARALENCRQQLDELQVKLFPVRINDEYLQIDEKKHLDTPVQVPMTELNGELMNLAVAAEQIARNIRWTKESIDI